MTDARIALAELVVAQDNFSFAQMTMQNVPKARERLERAWSAARAVLAAQPDNDQSGREGNKAGTSAEQSTHGCKAPTQGESAEYLAPDPTAAPAQGEPQDYDVLVVRLRDVLRNWTNVTDDEQSVIRAAADAIAALRECVRAADAMRGWRTTRSTFVELCDAYDAARAKVQP